MFFNHKGRKEGAEDTEIFLTQITQMAQIFADFKDLEGLANLPGLEITQRENACHHRT